MYLKKDDVDLYYEVRGEGETLLLIHGAIVDGDFYKQAAEYLSKFYQVITYDRRGNSRSKMKEDGLCQLEQQAEDIHDLLDAAGADKAYILGHSMGAVAGLYFLEQYPERVKQLIMYEPAILCDMKDAEPEYRKWASELMDLIERKKYSSALLRFAESIGEQDPRSPQKPGDVSMRELSNLEQTFTKEVPGVLTETLHIDRMLEFKDRIIVAAGERSTGSAYWQETHRLAELMGKKVVFYPGGHNLPYDLPMEFAINVLGTLKLQNS